MIASKQYDKRANIMNTDLWQVIYLKKKKIKK
jgi:hypothetical protein